MKMGAVMIAKGTKVTVLVKKKRANPTKNHTTGM
jgi:hypothetical protein